MEQALEADLFDELMVRKIEPRLGAEKPTFLYDYPAERGALARLKNENPALAERFELYIGGVELANAFSELADAEEQRRRFIKEQAIRREMLKPVYPMPERFLEELGGMGPSAGAALGVDRLVMVLLDAPRIDDVVAFTPEEL
jgi:lysyl-tRNA synthetase class 2